MIKKGHICKKNNLEIIEKGDKCLSEKELTDKAKDIIKLNPLFSLIKQQKKLHDDKIYLEDKKVKRIINKVKNDIFEKDEQYVNNINLVTITIDEKLPNAHNIPFCPVFNKFINPSKNNRLEKFIILTTIFHLLFLKNSSNIFKNATFKVDPKNYYQILNILIYEENNSFIFPVAHIIMSNKSFLSYKKVFQELKNLLNEYKINIKFNDYIITCDFEKSFIKAIKEEFIGIKISGCYFHFIKSLWKK